MVLYEDDFCLSFSLKSRERVREQSVHMNISNVKVTQLGLEGLCLWLCKFISQALDIIVIDYAYVVLEITPKTALHSEICFLTLTKNHGRII